MLAPIPFGAIEAWSWSFLGTAVGLLLIVWAADLAASGAAAPAGLRRLWPLVLPFAVVAVWIAFQTETGTLTTQHHPLWKTTAEVLGVPVQGSVSLDRYETGAALFRLLTYGGIFWLALQHGRDAARARQMMQAVVVAGVAYAAYGLAVEFSGAQMILWYDKVRYVDSLTSTFWYKNAYATYAGLGLVAALGLFVAAIGETTGAGFGRRETAAMLVNRLLARDWIILVALVVLPTALLLSDSRAGFLATCFGLLVLLIAARLGERRAAR
ncbi:MAG: hypothetical protein FJX67_13855, partial [Alphaproteobacteria bacterium]|nr:hypothetical protein [Alphaproteobacteria bacterium]